MDAAKIFKDVSKIPIIGDIIISFAIYFVLSLIAGTTNNFTLEEKYSSHLPNIFLYIASAYFVRSVSIKIYKFIHKINSKNRKL